MSLREAVLEVAVLEALHKVMWVVAVPEAGRTEVVEITWGQLDAVGLATDLLTDPVSETRAVMFVVMTPAAAMSHVVAMEIEVVMTEAVTHAGQGVMTGVGMHAADQNATAAGEVAEMTAADPVVATGTSATTEPTAGTAALPDDGMSPGTGTAEAKVATNKEVKVRTAAALCLV